MDELALAGIGIFVLILVLGILVAYIFYLIALQDTLKQVSPQNRSIRPGQVWLILIPLFGSVYQFIMVSRLSDSIGSELRSRGIAVQGRPTYTVGLLMSILSLCGFIPVIGSLAGIAYLVCWIMHWVQAVQSKRQLQLLNTSTDPDSVIFGKTPTGY